MPYALCSIYQALLASGGARPPKTHEVMRGWGLDALADDMQRASMDATVSSLFNAFG